MYALLYVAGDLISILECTGLSEEEKKRLLHCVVVGGGPTGVEFSGELSDFIMSDVRDRYTHVKDYVKVTLIEVHIYNTHAPRSILTARHTVLSSYFT
jgi:NADH dehydrogenase FAD-containing subunit